MRVDITSNKSHGACSRWTLFLFFFFTPISLRTFSWEIREICLSDCKKNICIVHLTTEYNKYMFTEIYIILRIPTRFESVWITFFVLVLEFFTWVRTYKYRVKFGFFTFETSNIPWDTLSPIFYPALADSRSDSGV